MTNEELREIEERAKAAGGKPWSWIDYGQDETKTLHETALNDGNGYGVLFHSAGWDMREADAKFIAHAREDVPKLIEEIKVLKVQVEEAKERRYADLNKKVYDCFYCQEVDKRHTQLEEELQRTKKELKKLQEWDGHHTDKLKEEIRFVKAQNSILEADAEGYVHALEDVRLVIDGILGEEILVEPEAEPETKVTTIHLDKDGDPRNFVDEIMDMFMPSLEVSMGTIIDHPDGPCDCVPNQPCEEHKPVCEICNNTGWDCYFNKTLLLPSKKPCPNGCEGSA